MRFPKIIDLDQEQRQVFNNAPSDKNIVITGSPGTGKTIMALHRAMKLAQLGKKPHLIMYNRVLAKYTNSGESKTDVKVSTMHKWIYDWWKGAAILKGKKLPMVIIDKYNKKFDWKAIFQEIIQINNKKDLEELNWGHLLIDEGQDFEEEMYFTLNALSGHFKSYELECMITVFADDNQRLQISNNSSVEDICKMFSIKKDDLTRKYSLTKNFRNTIETANFAKYFQVKDHETPQRAPTRKGTIPSIYFFDNTDTIVKFIIRLVLNYPGKQYGIIIDGTKYDVNQYYKKISESKDIKNIKVQAYISGNNNFSDEKLNFLIPNSITILNKQSAKGTEFDYVFYLGLEKKNFDSSEGINEKMSLYVMSSRPREDLYILFNNVSTDAAHMSILKTFPNFDNDICKYSGFGALKGKEKLILKT